MNTAVETVSPTRVKLSVEVPFDEVRSQMDAAYKRIGAQINVPGFRKGKVPTAVIDQRVGRAAVLEEAVNDIIPQAYNDAVRENDIKVLGQPEVDVTSYGDNEPLTFTAEVDVRPEYTLPAYTGLKVTVDDVKSDEDAVNEQIDKLRDRFATLTPVERAVENGDYVTLDLSATDNGEPVPDGDAKGLSYVVGSGELIPGIDEALVGLSVDETANISTPLVGSDHDADIAATVRSVRSRELPEANDDFAQLASEFDTIDELRAEVSKQATEMAKLDQALQARDRVLEALLDSVEIPMPEKLIENETNEHLAGEGREADDTHRAEVDRDLRISLKRQFVLDDIAKAENLTVGENELSEYLIQQAMRYGMTPEQFASEITRSGQIQSVVGDVLRGKALSFVLENSEIVDESGNKVELETLASASVDGDDHEGHDHDHEGHTHD